MSTVISFFDFTFLNPRIILRLTSSDKQESVVPINHTQSRLRDGHAVFGCIFQQFRSAEIPRLLAAAGFDFVFIDCEHGGFDLETIQDVVRVSRLAGITPLVRVGELSYSLAARALDVGAQGIILPRVEEPELLREALSWMKFPPMGKRGFGLGPPQLDRLLEAHPCLVVPAGVVVRKREVTDGVGHRDRVALRTRELARQVGAAPFLVRIEAALDALG